MVRAGARSERHGPSGILQASPSRPKGSYVFLSATGETPLDTKNFYHRIFQPALRRAGIDNFRWHDLRHTFGSRLLMRGADIRSVQELMRHKTLTTTLRYAHLSTDHRIAVVRLLDIPTEGRTGTRNDFGRGRPEGARGRRHRAAAEIAKWAAQGSNLRPAD